MGSWQEPGNGHLTHTVNSSTDRECDPTLFYFHSCDSGWISHHLQQLHSSASVSLPCTQVRNTRPSVCVCSLYTHVDSSNVQLPSGWVPRGLHTNIAGEEGQEWVEATVIA